MSVKIVIILFYLTLAHSAMYAQIFTTVIDETALQFRVKQIDEFMERFNNQVNYRGEKPQQSKGYDERRKNVLTLLNLDKFATANGQLDSIAQKFVDYIINNDIKIAYEDTTWYAEASGSCTYEKRKYALTLFLKTEQIGGHIYKWVVTNLASSLFDQFPVKPQGALTIPPSDHGISFISLPEMFNLNNSAVAYAYQKGYERNYLSVFDFLMATNKIRMLPITKVLFHFHLNDFDFVVERIEKDNGYNQGWLINNIFDNHEK